MTYLDYSATTKIDDEVLEEVSNDLFIKATLKDLKEYQNIIKNILDTDLEVIFTSGASESNNMAIKGICKNSDKKTILTTYFEHSSIKETLSFLEQEGFNIKYIPFEKDEIDLVLLKDMLDDVSLIIASSVSTETGMLLPINEIGLIAKEYNIPFLVDMTGTIGKLNLSFDNIDLISFSAHKFYGPKGIGVLLKRKDLELKPFIYGERTYNLGLIKGLVKALEESLKDLNIKTKKVEDLNHYLVDNLKSLPNIIINKSKKNIPHILNISVLNYKPETFLHYLEQNDIFISTKSACSSDGSYSEAVLALTGDKKRASTSVRISLSYKTTKEEIDKLIEVIKREEHAR